MKKTIIKTAITIFVLSLFTFSIYISFQIGLISDNVKMIVTGPSIREDIKTTNKEIRKKASFNLPKVKENDIFIHEPEPHADIDDITSDVKVVKNENKQVTSMTYRLSVYTELNTSSYSDTINKHTLVNDAPVIYITKHIWESALKPYLDALNDFSNSAHINIKWTFSYNDKNDIMPEYITMEAYTIETTELNFKVTFHNITKDGPIDYTKAIVKKEKVVK